MLALPLGLGKLDRGVNVAGQLVAQRAKEAQPYSLSCNPDLTLDLLKLRLQGRVEFLFAGQVNSELPRRRRKRPRPAADAGLLPAFPFGTDFTEVEQRLIPALQTLKSAAPVQFATLLMRGLSSRSDQRDCLDPMGLANPKNPPDWLYAAFVRGALALLSEKAA